MGFIEIFLAIAINMAPIHYDIVENIACYCDIQGNCEDDENIEEDSNPVVSEENHGQVREKHRPWS
jgi:hypothetical protein